MFEKTRYFNLCHNFVSLILCFTRSPLLTFSRFTFSNYTYWRIWRMWHFFVICDGIVVTFCILWRDCCHIWWDCVIEYKMWQGRCHQIQMWQILESHKLPRFAPPLRFARLSLSWESPSPSLLRNSSPSHSRGGLRLIRDVNFRFFPTLWCTILFFTLKFTLWCNMM